MDPAMQEFIDNNRVELDRRIQVMLEGCNFGLDRFDINDHERELWVLNIKKLYKWARSEGAIEERWMMKHGWFFYASASITGIVFGLLSVALLKAC